LYAKDADAGGQQARAGGPWYERGPKAFQRRFSTQDSIFSLRSIRSSNACAKGIDLAMLALSRTLPQATCE